MSDIEHNSTDTGASDAEHVTTGTGTAPHDTTGSGTGSGAQGEDVSVGNDGYEYHRSTGNNHELHASELHDSVLIGNHDDLLAGGTRNDVLDGGDGNNTLDGGSGDDVLVAGGQTNRGQNHLNGGSGDDILVAGGTKTHALDDFLTANPGVSSAISADPKYAGLTTIVRGAADDTGGGAMNTFELQSGNGHDSIFNFHAQSDHLQIHRGLNGSDIQDVASLSRHIHVSGSDVSIDLGGSNSVTLVGVDVGHLTEANLTWI